MCIHQKNLDLSSAVCAPINFNIVYLDSLRYAALSVQFQFPMYIFTEGDQNVAIVAILSIPAEVDLTVTFTPADGTANGNVYWYAEVS